MRVIAIWLALGLAACSDAAATPASPRPAPYAAADGSARAFALRLIDVLERDDLVGWRELLSARMRARTDDVELRRLFETWRTLLVPHADALRAADWTARNDIVRYRTVGASPARLVRVVEEQGALRIDEN
jgi:hypothetical protein